MPEKQATKEIVALTPEELGGLMTETGLRLPRGCSLEYATQVAYGLARMESARSWWYGDFALQIEELFPDKTEQIWRLTGMAYSTCKNAKSVCKMFPQDARVYKLSYTHYYEVAQNAKLGAAERHAVLKAAETKTLSARNVRDLIALPAPSLKGAVKAIERVKDDLSINGKRKAIVEAIRKAQPVLVKGETPSEKAPTAADTRPMAVPDGTPETIRSQAVSARDYMKVALMGCQRLIPVLSDGSLNPFEQEKLARVIDAAKASRDEIAHVIAAVQPLLDDIIEARVKAKGTSDKAVQKMADDVNRKRVVASA